MLRETNGWVSHKDHLEKTFEFKTFLKTMSFVNAVAWEANNQNHHPEIIINFNKCTIRTTTHDSGNKITNKDYELANGIDRLINS